MSLQYNSIAANLRPGVKLSDSDKTVLINQLNHLQILDSDQMQLEHYDIYPLLFEKIRKVVITVNRSERHGIDIAIQYILVGGTTMSLHFRNKKSKEIRLVIYSDVRDDDNTDYIDPSVFLQKLLLDRLPNYIKNVLMYYIYNPKIHDLIDIESYVGPTQYADEIDMIKTKTNYPPVWRMNNKWEEVSNFTFSLVESVHHTKYEKPLPYPITLTLDVCKNLCREGEESIVVNKTFK